jgi:hypothetical protein
LYVAEHLDPPGGGITKKCRKEASAYGGAGGNVEKMVL